ncbi:hypothetical protein FDB55_03980 [Clostridium botulinum]|uniref:Uncharacterized protein n=1 Tax=Clostridium botulinum TaxID=1491 RepID=A0A0L9Y465_CLOBO|nr:hypothetical protein [Clostridium botulinum]KAI3346587.1 hypothetical protein CIT18_13970 [Clostridium botulinum]KOM86600.1 hypothetical protein ACP51_16420 [Clostridium botulinum]KOR55763.1 hypothetical protein ADT22_14645 [Clostridium botulinum]MCS6111358.1 hypothetical protein [Clostridium botulinum]NFE12093.1 hypothetical protein [Clostridium botulinum]
MFYKEIKDLLNKLNSTNIDDLKPTLTRKVNELILNINDDNMSDCELEELCDFFITREALREEVRQEDSLSEGLLIENFIKAFDTFIEEINTKEYVSDAIDLTNTAIRSIGGIARGFRLMKKYALKEDVIKNHQYLIELKEEFYKQLRSYSTKGLYEEHFVICGLINTIKFDLEEHSQEHGQFVISILTDYETQKLKSPKEFEEEHSDEHSLDNIKNKMKSEFGIELQRRIYSWNNLTRKLTDHYYLENLYNEDCDD